MTRASQSMAEAVTAEMKGLLKSAGWSGIFTVTINSV